MTVGELLNIVTPLHRRTARDYVGRMTDEKVHCMEVARRYDRDFWDVKAEDYVLLSMKRRRPEIQTSVSGD